MHNQHGKHINLCMSLGMRVTCFYILHNSTTGSSSANRDRPRALAQGWWWLNGGGWWLVGVNGWWVGRQAWMSIPPRAYHVFKAEWTTPFQVLVFANTGKNTLSGQEMTNFVNCGGAGGWWWCMCGGEGGGKLGILTIPPRVYHVFRAEWNTPLKTDYVIVPES